MAIKIGLIAEDISDVEVIKILMSKVSRRKFATCHFVGRGCGPIIRKTPGWCRVLSQKGCARVIVVDDKDRNDSVKLRATLEQLVAQVPNIKGVVVIPVEELEAWLLSDSSAIAAALGLEKEPKNIARPESVASPKEFIGKEVSRISKNGTRYVNTVHNKLIASLLDLAKVTAKCPSFHPLAEFLA